MKNWTSAAVISIFIITSCSRSEKFEKGFSVYDQDYSSDREFEPEGFHFDSVRMQIKTNGLLLTANKAYHLATNFRVNYSNDGERHFTGTVDHHYAYHEDLERGDNWHSHIIPGFSAAHGFNLLGLGLICVDSNVKRNFFEKPVLIRTVYYPAVDQDTVRGKAVKRNYYMISVYDEDTNRDSVVNLKDIRHFYLFNEAGHRIKAIVPQNSSVSHAKYDPANDYLFVYTQLDKNANGQIEETDPTQLYWIDLKNPERGGLAYP